MDLAKGMQRAIQYIEDNMFSELDTDEIARKAYVSPFHFQRLFSLLSGMTLGTYIRNRRLSLAAIELQTSDIKVIDIALKCRYDSPESFSRAFERFHSVLPSAARVKGTKVNSLSPLSIKVSLEGGSTLTYYVEEMDSFRVVGKSIRHGDGYEAPAEMWRKCNADGTVKMLGELSTSPNKEIIGLSDGSSYDGETQEYCIGTFYEKDKVPEGFIAKEIPARTWVKFMCKELTDRDNEAEIWRRIYQGYFPTSNYTPNEYQMVIYPAGTGNYEQELGEIWVEVKELT